MGNDGFQGKVLEYLAQLTQDMTGMKQDITGIKERVAKVETDVAKTRIQIENEISPKIAVLFDGYKQHTEQLNRIEEKVSTHEEIIYKRIK